MDGSLVSYVPFARKYRPKNFKELMGQEVLTKTLSYCIANQKIAGTILLTGIRGVGKTSSARIIAKTVNCSNPVNEKLLNNDFAETIILPCQHCKNCQSFVANNHPDVVEMDAASRTSVDDIREIIESSEYKPLLGRYKIFIIDEVHMLSKNAFNALLKVVEEPPPHVIFIFATTEAQKIPLTVLSRCQRYDLRRFSFEEIFSLLEKIAKTENLNIEPEALKIIAQKSEGSARDAIVILDQASSYVVSGRSVRDNVISAELVNQMLGLVRVEIILKLVQLIVAGNTKLAIKTIDEIYLSSSNLEYFLYQISDFIANLIKEKTIKDFSDPLYKNLSTEIAELLIGISLSRLSILWQIFANGANEVKSSHNELISTQMIVIKAIHSLNLPKIEDILNSSSDVTDFITLSKLDDESEKQKATARVPNPSIDQNTDISSALDFLKFCHKHNEMELYYSLLNDLEVKIINQGNIEIFSNSKFTQEKKLKSVLHDWSGIDWKIVEHTGGNQITSLKQILLEKAKSSEDFAVIKNHFPSADISDIILKL